MKTFPVILILFTWLGCVDMGLAQMDHDFRPSKSVLPVKTSNVQFNSYQNHPATYHFLPEFVSAFATTSSAQTFRESELRIPLRCQGDSESALVALIGMANMRSSEASSARQEGVSDVIIQIQVVPVDVLFIADFDPSNIASAPLLFIINVSNDEIQRSLIVKLIVSGASTGDLIVGTKVLDDVQPNATKNFTNRDFDDYDTTPAGEAVLIEASSTGMLPPDTYTYRVQVLDDEGQVIAEDEDTNTTTNPTSELELIGPGTLFGEEPEVIYNPNPFLQWYSNANSYDVSVYPLFPGQTSAEEVVENRPVYREVDLQNTSFLYPTFAEELMPGHTYAWQVNAHVTTSQGEQILASPVFWFRVEAGIEGAPEVISVDRVEIQPLEVELKVGDSYQFRALVYDEAGNTLSISPQWRVVPEAGGSIDQTGLFVAAQRPMTVAVVARIGQIQEYATVTIQWRSPGLDMFQFLKELFGLPEQ